MRLVLASSFANAFLGGLATWAFIVQGDFLVWAAVIAWGCFFHTGGAPRSVLTTIVGNSWGCLCAWTAGLLFTVGPVALPGSVWSGLVVFVAVIVMVFVGHQMAIYWKMTVVVVPACFYGAASTFAYMIQTPGKLAHTVLLSASTQNPLVAIPISMAVGALLGLATARMTEFLGVPQRRDYSVKT